MSEGLLHLNANLPLLPIKKHIQLVLSLIKSVQPRENQKTCVCMNAIAQISCASVKVKCILRVFVWVFNSKFYIRKTCPYNVYPLEPHFYIVKLGFAGVYLFLLFLLQNIDCFEQI